LPKRGGLCQAVLEAFDLHAKVWVPGRNRAWLERPGYMLRPPAAQERLKRRHGGRVLVELTKQSSGLPHNRGRAISFRLTMSEPSSACGNHVIR